MKTKTLVLLGLAIFCGLLASFMTSRLLAQRSSAPQEEEEKTTVLACKQKLTYGQRLDVPENFLEETQVRIDSAPPGAIKKWDDVRGRIVMAHMLAQGRVITKDDVMAGDMAGVQGQLAAGKRAVALTTNAVAAAGGLIVPQTHVDVMLTTSSETRVILSDMLVIAVDTHQKVDQGSTIIPQTVTLEADPDQAVILIHAQSKGKVHLSVRPFGDKTDTTQSVARDGDFGKKGILGPGKSDETTPVGVDLTAPKSLDPKSPDKVIDKPDEDTPPPPVVKKKKAFVQELYNGNEKIINYFDDETGKAIPSSEIDQYELPKGSK